MWRVIYQPDLTELVDFFEFTRPVETFTSDVLEDDETFEDATARLAELGLELPEIYGDDK